KVLAEVIWALGRMQSAAATPGIIALLDHKDATVRRNAWLSLGLIEDDVAVQRINDVLKKPNRKPEDAAAWTTAIGLMDEPDGALLKAMLPIIKQRNVSGKLTILGKNSFRNEATFQARMAMWTLRIHNPPGVSQFAQKLMPFTTDPILFDEAIQTIAASPDETLILKLFNPIYHSRLTDFLKMPRAFYIDGSAAHTPSLKNVLDVDFPNALPSLRASAAFAYDNPAILKHSKNGRLIHLVTRQLARSYALFITNPQAVQNGSPSINQTFKYDSWRGVREGPFNVYSYDDIGFALRFGLIPLGKLGDHDLDAREDPVDGRLLCDILLGKYVEPAHISNKLNILGKPVCMDDKYDPSRSFAAIALGFYTRNRPSETSSIRHDKTKEIVKYIQRLLTRTAQNEDEPELLRSACALALGLGRNETANENLLDILKQSPHPMVSAYAILALSMLGDQRAAILVHKAFEEEADQIDVEKIRAQSRFDDHDDYRTHIQRVLVQCLANLCMPQANRMLYPYLMRDNLYTSREIIRAIKWSGDKSIHTSLIQILEKPGQNAEKNASFCAWALGELYDSDPFSKAHRRLLKNRNFTLVNAEYNSLKKDRNGEPSGPYVRHENLRHYLQLTNHYLFSAMTDGNPPGTITTYRR
ncbi:MAG: HEAT repeat domain-containing protein, partial [Phycisphaeraceae bacterium JB051]